MTYFEFTPRTYTPELPYERRQRMVDARRTCRAVIEECIFWININLRNGRDASVRLAMYREHLRYLSEYDVELAK